MQEQQQVLKGVGKLDTLEAVHSHTEHRKQRSAQNQSRRARKTTEQAGTDRDRTLNSAAVVGKTHIHVTNALPRTRATMVPCAMPRLLLLSQQKVLATSTLHFLIQLHQTKETAWFADVQMGAETLCFKAPLIRLFMDHPDTPFKCWESVRWNLNGHANNKCMWWEA